MRVEGTTYIAIVGVLHGNPPFATVSDIVDCHNPLLLRIFAGAVEFGDLAECCSSPLHIRAASGVALMFKVVSEK